ncbi:MAG: glycosyltransferase [bacterium]
MRVSIIIPTWNEEAILPTLFSNLRAQSFRDFEVIVADANSSDRTREIATGFGARVVPGGLPGAGRNAGARVAQGEILLFLDADVVLPDPGFLEATVREFETKRFDLSTCLLMPISTRLGDRIMLWFYNAYTLATTRILAHVPGFCVFVKRSLHEKIHGFDEQVVFAEDHEYARRAVQFGRFGFLKSRKLPMSMRRFDRDGRLQTALKYACAEVYMIFKGGIKSDIFKYSFGHKNPEAKS